MTLEECYTAMGANYQDVLKRFYKSDMIRRFVKMFLQDDSFRLLTDAMAKQDVKEAFRAAHTLKGVCLNLGFDNLSSPAVALTEILRAGTFEGAAEQYAIVKTEYDRTIKAIELYESLHPNVKIEYEYYSFDDYFTKLKTLVASDQVWDIFQLGGNFPTRVDQVKAVDATVDHAMNMFKFTPELLLSYQKVALEAQYFFNRYNRRQHIHAFTGQGGYVTLRGLLIGDRYGYAMVDGGLATPSAKSLELVLSYNYTTLTDEHAGIWGGRVNDVSATLNYYINKYMLFRFRYAYTHRWDCDFAPKVDLSAFQARLQIIF